MAGDCSHLGPPGKRARVGADRLSDLPDCLLHDVLSRLGSRQAVQTSALSRRWRHVWRSVPCVDIDQREFPGSGAYSSRQQARFEDFGDNMLALAGTAPSWAPGAAPPPPLDTFRLHLVDRRVTSSFARWVRRGLRRRPAAVDLRCADADVGIQWPPYHVDLSAFACRLTTLHLSGVRLGDRFGEQLGVECPVLEDLHVDRCHHGSCTIASPTLKSLMVICRVNYSSAVTLAIAAPRLASLRLVLPFGGTGTYPAVVTTAPGHGALASLVKASIYICDQDVLPRRNQRASKAKLQFLRSICSLLPRLTNARDLQLYGFTTTALLDQESQDFPSFQNLRTLVLDACDVGAINFQVLMKILENAPNLEQVGLQRCEFVGRPRRRKGQSGPKRTCPKQRVSTLVRHKKLKFIQINYQPHDIAHLKEFFSGFSKKTPKKMQQWRVAKKPNTVHPSASVNTREEVSTAARVTPVQVSTIYLYRFVGPGATTGGYGGTLS